MKLVLVTPRVSEKSYRLVTNQNTYIFDVPMSANKNDIKAAVESQFDGTKVATAAAKIATRAQPRARTAKKPTLHSAKAKSKYLNKKKSRRRSNGD